MSKISLLPPADPLDGSEAIPLVQDGETKKAVLSEYIETAAREQVEKAEQFTESLGELFEISYFGKHTTPINTGSNVGVGTYVFNDPKPYDRVISLIEVYCANSATIPFSAFSRDGSVNTGEGAPVSKSVVSGLNTLEIEIFVPAGQLLGFYLPAGNIVRRSLTAADGGGYYYVGTDETEGSFTDSSVTDTAQIEMRVIASHQVVTAESQKAIQQTADDLQDAFDVEPIVNLFDPDKAIDNQVINLSGTFTAGSGKIFLGFQAVEESKTYTFKLGHWIGFASELTFVCLDDGGDDNSPSGAYEGIAPANGSNTSAPNPPTITFDGYDTATIVMPASTDVRYIGINTGTWAGHTTADFDAVVASAMFYEGTEDTKLIPPTNVNFNRLKATHLPTADYLTPAVYPTAGRGVFQRVGNSLYWRTKWSVTQDLVQRFIIEITDDANSRYPEFGGTRLIPIAAANTPAAFTNGTEISKTLDDVGPLSYGGTSGTTDYSYFGGSHGCDDAIALTSTAHGKANADIGSIWTDGATQFVICRITSANILLMMARNQATAPAWDFPDSIAGTLTHVSGATNTGSIPITSQTTVQLIPGTVRNELTIRLDGVASTEVGPILAKTFDLNHRLDIASPASIVTFLENNIGSTSWNDDDVKADVTRDIIYRWSAGGACIYSETIVLQNGLEISHRFAAQATKIEAPASGTISAYVPGTDPVPISTDGMTLADVANEYALTVTTEKDITVSDSYWDSATEPPLMTAQIAKDSGGDRVRSFAIGFVPDRGDAIALEDLCAATVTIKSSSPGGTTGEDKFYLLGAAPDYNEATRRFDGEFAAAGTAYNATTYRGWTNSEDNSDIRLEFWGDCPDGRGIVVLDYAAAQTLKKVALHPEWAGRAIEVTEGGGLTLVSGDRVGTDGIVINTSGAGRAVLTVTG